MRKERQNKVRRDALLTRFVTANDRRNGKRMSHDVERLVQFPPSEIVSRKYRLGEQSNNSIIQYGRVPFGVEQFLSHLLLCIQFLLCAWFYKSEKSPSTCFPNNA